MQEIVKRIESQQRVMGYLDFAWKSEQNRMQYIREIVLALVKETSEFLDEVPWKPWALPSNTKSQYDTEKANLEICDIIVFAVVLHLTLDPETSLEEAMEQTLTKIDNRINSGYGPKEKL